MLEQKVPKNILSSHLVIFYGAFKKRMMQSISVRVVIQPFILT